MAAEENRKHCGNLLKVNHTSIKRRHHHHPSVGNLLGGAPRGGTGAVPTKSGKLGRLSRRPSEERIGRARRWLRRPEKSCRKREKSGLRLDGVRAWGQSKARVNANRNLELIEGFDH